MQDHGERDQRAGAGNADRRGADGAPAGGNGAGTSGAHSNGDVWRSVREAGDYLLLYVRLMLATGAVRLRTVVFKLGVMAGGSVVMLAIIILGAAYLLRGMAGGLAILFDDRLWLAELVTGGFVALCAVASVGIAYRVWISRHMSEMKDELDRRKSRQRSEFGRDVDEAARTHERNSVSQTATSNGSSRTPASHG